MKLLVIDGSVRESRSTDRVTTWVEKIARQSLQDVEIETIDLKELDLPMFNEPTLPMMNPDRQPEGNLKVWLDALETADGYVIVTPEYNHGLPSGLKNAIDYINFQIMHKPFTVVSHGVAGGARASEQVKQVLNANIGGVPIPASVTIAGMIGSHEMITEGGEANSEAVTHAETGLKHALDKLVWFAEALSQKRNS